ncbi:MAG: UDP-2,3-diacylglucosamine diphosphatase [Gemmatimonadota bacterium]
MLPAPAYVISDAHLGFATREVEQSLLSFLRHLRGRAGSLVINGDLFEFWFEWRHVMPRRAFRVLSLLADLRESGVPVLMLAGNHDCWGGDILRTDVGLDYRLGAWEGSLGGWHTRIDHGDGLRKVEDRKYRMLRRVLRSPISIALFRWLHPDLGSALAAGSSNTSRNYQPRDGGAGLRAVAQEALAAHNAPELVVYAHSHVAALERIGPGVYGNAGGWMDRPTYLRVSPEKVELCQWIGDDEVIQTSIARISK